MSTADPARAACLVAVALLLAACGDRGEEARARHEAAQHPKADTAATGPAAPDTEDMVAAVSTADATRPVSLKFRLSEPPRVGEPLQLVLALIPEPKAAIHDMHVAMQPREGLQLKSAATIDFANPEAGATQLMQVAVLPQQLGVLSLAVTVLVNTEHDSLARGYTIPLIVVPSAPAPAPAPATPPARAPATGSATRH
jgi:hypothetical protein